MFPIETSNVSFSELLRQETAARQLQVWFLELILIDQQKVLQTVFKKGPRVQFEAMLQQQQRQQMAQAQQQGLTLSGDGGFGKETCTNGHAKLQLLDENFLIKGSWEAIVRVTNDFCLMKGGVRLYI